MIHPKIQAAGLVSLAYTVLVLVLGALNALPDNEWAKAVAAILGAVLPVLAGYATPGGAKGVAVDQGSKP